MHRLCHSLQKIAQSCNVRLVFSAPERLSRLCRAVNAHPRKGVIRDTKPCHPFVPCAHESCTPHRCYVAKITSSRRVGASVQPSIHALPWLQLHSTFWKVFCYWHTWRPNGSRNLEVAEIHRLGGDCVSRPSLSKLSKKELHFLKPNSPD